MTTDKLDRANEIMEELKLIHAVLCKTDPSKEYSLHNNNGAIAALAKRYEAEFCEIIVKHQKALESEFEKL